MNGELLKPSSAAINAGHNANWQGPVPVGAGPRPEEGTPLSSYQNVQRHNGNCRGRPPLGAGPSSQAGASNSTAQAGILPGPGSLRRSFLSRRRSPLGVPVGFAPGPAQPPLRLARTAIWAYGRTGESRRRHEWWLGRLTSGRRSPRVRGCRCPGPRGRPPR